MTASNDPFSAISDSFNFFVNSLSKQSSPDKTRYEQLKKDLMQITSTLGNAKDKLKLASDYLDTSFQIDGKSIDKNGKLKQQTKYLSTQINNINNIVIARDIAKKLK